MHPPAVLSVVGIVCASLAFIVVAPVCKILTFGGVIASPIPFNTVATVLPMSLSSGLLNGLFLVFSPYFTKNNIWEIHNCEKKFVTVWDFPFEQNTQVHKGKIN